MSGGAPTEPRDADEAVIEPFTAELTIKPGEVIEGSAANGFEKSMVILRSTERGASDCGDADLRWGAEVLGSGLTVAAFLNDFWSGERVAHCDALDFGRLVLRRLLADRDMRERWDTIRSWRGARPLRMELILPTADRSPISAVPFELLADDRSFLFFAGRSVLVRCIRDLKPRPARIRRGDRLLVAWANPIGIEPRVEDQIFEEHEESVARSGREAALEVLPPVGRANRTRFEDTLEAQRPVPLVSLVAHGYQRGGELAFQNPDHTAEPVPATSIAAALRAGQTQVALLWSCHGARHNADLGSLAELLLDPDGGDLAAVLAAHGAVRADWTPRAVRRIFTSLTTIAGNDLEQAITYARQTLTEKDPQWAALAYYARPAAGRSVTYEAAARAVLDALVAPAGGAALVEAPYMTSKGLPMSGQRVDLLERLGGPGITRSLPSFEHRTDKIDGIPRPPRYWVDRPVEIREIVARVMAGRPVTVRGMPGIGKTQVARAAAEALIRHPALTFEAAVWIALDELASVGDLRARIAAWAGVSDPDAPDWRLVRAIGDRRVLWVLDNAEDLIRREGPELRSFLGGITGKCGGLSLLVTSQRPLGALNGEPEETFVVRRIESADTCMQLFARATRSPLGERAESSVAREIVELLDGHPRSLVLVAGQIRDGGANLPDILRRLKERTDEAVLAAELLESGVDWTAGDRLRAEHLVASLHLAYRPLREAAPAAAELFAWLGTLPAGLPVALAGAIFGDDAHERIATLRRFSLVELRGDDERLELPAPVRWYAERRLDEDVPPERQAELLARTFDGIGSLMAAAYERIGKPGAGIVVEMSRREEINLESLLQRAERGLPATPSYAQIVARAFWRWAEVRQFGGNLSQPLTLVERTWTLVAPSSESSEYSAYLQSALGDLYHRIDRLADAERVYTKALAAFFAIDDHLGTANTLRALGDLYLRTERLDDAKDTYNRALTAFVHLGDRLGEANTLKALGDLYFRITRLDDAEGTYNKALATFIAINNRLGEASTRKALGDLYLRTKRVSAALTAYRDSIACFSDIDDPLDEAMTLLALGDLYLYIKRPADAKDALTKALTIFAAIDHPLGEANTISSMGQLAVDQGNLIKGFEQFRTARERMLVLDARLSAAGQIGNMARAAAQAQAYDRAIVLGGMARQELRVLDDYFGVLLAGQDLIEVARQAQYQELARHALILSWHTAIQIDEPLTAEFIEDVRRRLPPEKIEAGLDPDEVDEYEKLLAAEVAKVAKRLEEAGEDPFGPLPSSPSSSSPPSSSEEP